MEELNDKIIFGLKGRVLTCDEYIKIINRYMDGYSPDKEDYEEYLAQNEVYKFISEPVELSVPISNIKNNASSTRSPQRGAPDFVRNGRQYYHTCS